MLQISTFRSARDPRPTPKSTSWDKLTQALAPSRPRVELCPTVCVEKKCHGTRAVGDLGPCPRCGGEMKWRKDQLRAWSPTAYRPGARKGYAGLVSVSALVLDVDDGTSIASLHETWSPWPHVIHTSYSHTLEVPRARVIVPLAEPVLDPGRTWWRVWQWAYERQPVLDPKCKDPCRIYFTPAVPHEDSPWETVVWNEPYEFLDVSQLVREAREAREARRQQRSSVQRARPTEACRVPAHKLRWALQRKLREEPAARRRVAELLDARIQEGPEPRAKGATCPSCARPSVWWSIHPRGRGAAFCDHRNSCGWVGWLDQLAEAHLDALEHA